MANSTVFILGAGAVIPWKCPTTKDITKKFIENASIYKIIYDECVNYYKSMDLVNFETIISVIEWLLDHHLNLMLSKRVQSSGEQIRYERSFSLHPNFFHEQEVLKKTESFKNFKPLNEKNKDYFYYLEVYLHLLYHIWQIIQKYNKDENIYSEENHEINNAFHNFYNFQKTRTSTVRFYTLNYDYLFPNILAKREINLFIGFDEKVTSTRKVNGRKNNYHRPDIEKIAINDSVDCYFNLHGSFNWDYLLVPFPKQKSEFQYSPTLSVYFPTQSAPYQYQNQTLTFPKNIITGISKNEKLLSEPINSFFFSLKRDLISADEIYIIGYSFSDHHINSYIAPYFTDINKKVVIVDKVEEFGAFQFLRRIEEKLQPFIGNQTFSIKYENDKVVVLNEFNISIFKNGFEGFLLNEQYE